MPEYTTSLLIFLFPLAYSPGPGNMFFAANGARFGLRATLAANIGYHLATWIVAFAIGFGFANTLRHNPQLFATIQVIGALYVLWLAYKIARADVIGDQSQSARIGFLDGAILLILNPKGYLIMGLMFSQFLAPSASNELDDVLWITTIFTLNNCVAFVLWTIAGDRIANYFRSPDTAQKLNLWFGIMLAFIAFWMLISTHPSVSLP